MNSWSSLYDCWSLSLLEFISISSCSCSASCIWHKRKPTKSILSDLRVKILKQAGKMLSVIVDNVTTCNLNATPKTIIISEKKMKNRKRPLNPPSLYLVAIQYEKKTLGQLYWFDPWRIEAFLTFLHIALPAKREMQLILAIRGKKKNIIPIMIVTVNPIQI